MALSQKAATLALADILEAWGGFDSDVQVQFGVPLQYTPDKMVVIGGQRNESTQPESFGARKFRERYEILVHCRAAQGGMRPENARGTFVEAAEIAEQVRSAVLNDLTLGGVADLDYAIPRAWETPEEGALPTDDGWVVLITVPIYCVATIT